MMKRILIRKCAVAGASAVPTIRAFARFALLETIAWNTTRATTQVRLINFPSQPDDFNADFYLIAGVSAIFYVVAFVSLVQLLICCFAEYRKLKNPSFLKACRITTQKFLYFVVFLASLLRAAYFTQPESVQPSWAYYLMSAYYPLLMTCASLVVCFWAEVSCRQSNYWHCSDSTQRGICF